jgi:hypothetical protein
MVMISSRVVARVQVVWVAWRRRWHRGGRKRRGRHTKERGRRDKG